MAPSFVEEEEEGLDEVRRKPEEHEYGAGAAVGTSFVVTGVVLPYAFVGTSANLQLRDRGLEEQCNQCQRGHPSVGASSPFLLASFHFDRDWSSPLKHVHLVP